MRFCSLRDLYWLAIVAGMSCALAGSRSARITAQKRLAEQAKQIDLLEIERAESRASVEKMAKRFEELHMINAVRDVLYSIPPAGGGRSSN